MEIFCNIIVNTLFTVTFDQFNAFNAMQKYISLKKILLTLSFWTVVYIL